jgi:hypothetical protein
LLLPPLIVSSPLSISLSSHSRFPPLSPV